MTDVNDDKSQMSYVIKVESTREAVNKLLDAFSEFATKNFEDCFEESVFGSFGQVKAIQDAMEKIKDDQANLFLPYFVKDGVYIFRPEDVKECEEGYLCCHLRSRNVDFLSMTGVGGFEPCGPWCFGYTSVKCIDVGKVVAGEEPALTHQAPDPGYPVFEEDEEEENNKKDNDDDDDDEDDE